MTSRHIPSSIDPKLSAQFVETLVRRGSGVIDLGLTGAGFDTHRETRPQETKLSIYAKPVDPVSEAEFFVRVKPVASGEVADAELRTREDVLIYGRPTHLVFVTAQNELIMPKDLAAILRTPMRLSEFIVMVY